MEDASSPSKSLLQKALTSLTQRDFSASRKFAAQGLESDPTIAGAEKVLAVAGIFLAGERLLRNDRPDFYSILQISRADSADCQLVWTRFERLATVVDPSAGQDDDEDEDVAAFSAEAYDLLFEAWSVLSDAEKKSKYDAEIEEEEEEEEGERTFWTVCPYCYCMFEYGKAYEECCLRCQNCRRAFHGVAIGEPPPEILIPAKDQYYFCYGVFPLAYKGMDLNVNVKEVLEISDGDSSSDEDCHRKGKRVQKDSSSSSSSGLRSSGGGGEEEDDLDGFWEEVLKNGNNESQSHTDEKWQRKFVKVRARRMKNVKSVASKKAGIRHPGPAESGEESVEDVSGNDGGSGDGNGGGELVFYEGGGDLFIGFEGTP